jgi:hypothetical protein
MQHEDAYYPAPLGMLVALRGSVARQTLTRLAAEGLVRKAGPDAWALTESGLAQVRDEDRMDRSDEQPQDALLEGASL